MCKFLNSNQLHINEVSSADNIEKILENVICGHMAYQNVGIYQQILHLQITADIKSSICLFNKCDSKKIANDNAEVQYNTKRTRS